MRYPVDDFDSDADEADALDGFCIGHHFMSQRITSAPQSREAIDRDWPVFVEAVNERLENGCATYGDSSFDRPLDLLITEIQQELMDVAGWGFILHQRLDKLRAKIAAVEATT